MSAKSNAALTTEIVNIITSMVNPESITPTTLGGLVKNIVDSFWNNIDSALTLPPTEMIKADLATAIGAGSLNDNQWIKITNRADLNPLFVTAQGTDRISPYGIQVIGGKPCAVIMDYANGFDGETNPFIAVFDENKALSLNPKIGDNNGKITRILSNFATIDFGSVPSQSVSEGTIVLKGAIDGDPVLLGVENAAAVPGDAGFYFAWISAPDTCSIRFVNASSGGLDPGSGKFTVTVIK